ncbi:MAG: hypothetical protein WDN04_14245 [Rhodospirillales bacterium]
MSFSANLYGSLHFFAAHEFSKLLRCNAPTLIARPQRIFQSARQLPIATSAPRTIQRQPIAVPARRPLIDIDFSEPSFDFQVDPYLDYGKCLTDEGGILIVYKDIDDRFRHILWRVFSWTLFTGLAAIYFAPYAPVPDHWIEIAAHSGGRHHKFSYREKACRSLSPR